MHTQGPIVKLQTPEQLEMSFVRRNNFAAELSTCWNQYMATGKVDLFINDMDIMFNNKRNLTDVQPAEFIKFTESVLQNYTIINAAEGTTSLTGNAIDRKYWVIVACLTALEAVLRSGNTRQYNTLRILLRAAELACIDYSTFRSAEEEVCCIN